MTGGAGFIGSHVNEMLFREGYETVILDNLSRGTPNAILHGTFIQGDVGNRFLLDRLFSEQQIDIVMHFAASTDVGESIENPLKYYQNNVGKTITLLESMKQYGVRYFIFSSSAAVYGLPQFIPITESHPCKPINPYGQSKLIVENILQDMALAHQIQFCSLRYFNAAGGDPQNAIRYTKREENNLIPKLLESLLSISKEMTIFGTDYPTPDGTCIRDYIHIEDLGRAHLLGMQKLVEGSESKIYNLGTGLGFSIKEVITAIEQVTGRNINLKIGNRRLGDPPSLVADFQKAQQELGWKPSYSLEDMIRHAWKVR